MKTMTLNREAVLTLKRYVDAAVADYSDLSVRVEPGGLIVKVGEFVWSPTIPAETEDRPNTPRDRHRTQGYKTRQEDR